VQETKRLLREEFSREWVAFAGPEADYAWDLLSSPAVVKGLHGMMQRLSKKPASKL
jgi:hypothetical protein